MAIAVQTMPATSMAPIAPRLGFRLSGVSAANASGTRIAPPKIIWPVAMAGGARLVCRRA